MHYSDLGFLKLDVGAPPSLLPPNQNMYSLVFKF